MLDGLRAPKKSELTRKRKIFTNLPRGGTRKRPSCGRIFETIILSHSMLTSLSILAQNRYRLRLRQFQFNLYQQDAIVIVGSDDNSQQKKTPKGKGKPEEVRHGHVRYALMNIPRTKNHQYNHRKRCAAKIMMGLGGFS